MDIEKVCMGSGILMGLDGAHNWEERKLRLKDDILAGRTSSNHLLNG